ncbi:MAG: M20/M25/M40 family metallo-hydrolase [Lewinella sp.]|uniref:M20/M25/M40 family metallo-hydrolase n=1 Tax=Lewinella sp. TaxID=2004506 RepID=UPI003D6C0887
MPRTLLLLTILVLATSLLSAQEKHQTEAAAAAMLPAYCDFLSLPCDANNPAELEPNIQWCEAQFGQRDFVVKRLPTAGIEVLLAEYMVKEDLPTVLFYVQIDGQPVDPAKWASGEPYTPMLGKPTTEGYTFLGELPQDWRAVDRSYRIFSRAASDAKGPIAMLLAAWDHLQQQGEEPAFNIKVIMDTEEELGSPNLPPVVEAYREVLSADHFVILDGPPHISNRPTLVFGARGIATARITVYGPKVPLHSGHYGNYAPNPALRLAQLLASMKNDAGLVTIPYWYDGITLDKKTLQTLAQVPDDLTEINHKLGFAAPDGVGNSLQEAIQYPSLNIRGISAGWVGAAARTIIPANAVANLDIRLVKESKAERLMDLLQAHIKAQGYYLITDGREPTAAERDQYPRIASFGYKVAYGAFRTPLHAPTGAWLEGAMVDVLQEDIVKIRTHGGSIPIAPFVETLGVPAVIVPLVNPDNNQHSPDENLMLSNYFRGVEVCYSILRTKIPQE